MAVLSGWKDIASHVERGVRTVQRWERLGLPVHRPKGKSRSSVIALSEELDVWLSTTPVRSPDDEYARLLQRIVELETEIECLRAALDRPGRKPAKSTALRLIRTEAVKTSSAANER